MVTSDLPAPALPRIPLVDLTAMSRQVRPALDRLWSDLNESSAFIGGEYVERFEEKWARYCGTRQAVGLANGTDAIELSLRALGIGPGYEVIVPANTFIATAEAVLLAGATPRFADVDPDTLLLTAESVDPVLTNRTAAVIAVHLYGAMPDMEKLQELCRDRGLVLIEDAAQAHGAAWSGRRAGSFGAVGCFSFYPAKNLGAFGDAGAVVTNDGRLAERIRQLGNHGRLARAPHRHYVVGRNSRLDALQACVLSAKLALLDEWNARRRDLVEAYRSRLATGGARMVRVDDRCQAAYHQNVVRLRRRDDVREVLGLQGIETGIHYPIPCHLQGPYRGYASEPLPVAELAAEEILSLPMFPHLTMGQVDRVSAVLNEALEEFGGTDD
jgi:dTDP-4-amino-4,6-dideoxygalactose transaminase